MSPADRTNPYADYTVEQMYAFLSGHELRRDIGEEYEYSNLGVGLLGHVLARVGGGSYEDVVRERILEPLGLSMTGITLEGDMRDWIAEGHNQQGKVVPLRNLPTLAGAGALRSNVRDMLTFLAANIGPPESQLERSMRASHEVRKNITPQMSIGLNWHVRNVGDENILWHNGGTAGFHTFIGFDPDKGVGAVVLTNSVHGTDDIGFHLLNTDVPLAPAPQERFEIEVGEEVLETYVGEYELAPTFSIVVTLEDGALFVQATAQPKFPVFAESEAKFFLKVVDAQVSFTKDDSGAVTGLILHQGGANQPGRKVSSEVPPAPDVVERLEVAVAEDILETYVGEYELAPTFSIVVTLEGGALFAQATGQGMAPIFAESETEFFYRVVDAQITFQRDADGVVTGLTLHQAGQNVPGRKIR